MDDVVIVPAHKRQEPKGKREEDLSSLPHEEPVFSVLTEEELLERLSGNYQRLPDEVYKRLEFHPVSFSVREYHAAVYASVDGKRFKRADRPITDLFRNSIAAPSLVSGILNYKYVNGLPVYHWLRIFNVPV